MRRTAMRRLYGCVGLVFAATVAALGVQAQPAMSEVWVYPGESANSAALQVELDPAMEAGHAVSAPIPFPIHFISNRRFHNSLVRFTVSDAAGTKSIEAELTLELTSGANECTFEWEAAAAPEGVYMGQVQVFYAPGVAPVEYAWPMRRVSSANFAGRLDAINERLAALAGKVDAAFERGSLPALDVKLAVAKRFQNEAGMELASGDWRALEANVRYLETAAARIFDGLLFSNYNSERSQSRMAGSLAHLEEREGSFFAEGRPVFLFGVNLESPEPDALAALPELGLNFGVFGLPPSEVLLGPGKARDYQARLAPFFAAAGRENISLSVQLMPEQAPAWALQAWPQLMADNRADLTRPGFSELFRWQVSEVLPYLASQPMVNSAGLLYRPAFRFDSEQVRQAFIAHVEDIYTDRYFLNRSWHTQFGSFDDIGLWGDYRDYYSGIQMAAGHEDTMYQERRPYQFDWQLFHQSLATGRLEDFRAFAKSQAPDLPLYVTLPDAAFAMGETRGGVDRDALAHIFDTLATEVIASADEPVFAMRYPGPVATCALMHSTAPEDVLLDLECVIEFGNGDKNDSGFITTLLWETALAGADATSLAADSEVFDRPYALEAFATACLDINRLAPTVHAFQRASSEVAVLFSDASKIFDEGVPHLQSCLYAYEGCSFGGYGVRFINEKQCIEGELDQVKVLVIPETPALSDAAFEAVSAYIENGGAVARAGTPIPYNERGESRLDVLPSTGKTVLVRGINLPTEYLHAIDAAIVLGALSKVVRPINASGYPLEGVKTRYLEIDENAYLYMVNLRKERVICHLTSSAETGRDLIRGRSMAFPCTLPPLEPVLCRLDSPAVTAQLAEAVK